MYRWYWIAFFSGCSHSLASVEPVASFSRRHHSTTNVSQLTSCCLASLCGGITSKCPSRIFQGAANSATTRTSQLYRLNMRPPHDTNQFLSFQFSYGFMRKNIEALSGKCFHHKANIMFIHVFQLSHGFPVNVYYLNCSS
jgi:hypothetical protein